MSKTDLKTIRDYFGIHSSDFLKEWKALTEQDREDIRSGFDNGSMTY